MCIIFVELVHVFVVPAPNGTLVMVLTFVLYRISRLYTSGVFIRYAVARSGRSSADECIAHGFQVICPTWKEWGYTVQTERLSHFHPFSVATHQFSQRNRWVHTSSSNNMFPIRMFCSPTERHDDSCASLRPSPVHRRMCCSWPQCFWQHRK